MLKEEISKIACVLLLLLFSFSGTNAMPLERTSPMASTAMGTRDVVQEIINVVGLQPRFELRAANIENAAAVIYNGKRYILYNERFLAAVNNAVKTDWAGVSIIAHEIGHHLNGHTLSRAGSNPKDELEADEFSGFVLRKMGASLAEAQAAIKLLSDERTSSTHPGKQYRLAALSKGWQSAHNQLYAGGNKSQRVDNTTAQRSNNVKRPAAVRVAPKQDVADSDPNNEVTNKFVLSRVHFSKAPKEEFYLTNKLHLVHVTNGQVKVIGKLIKTDDDMFPYYFESKYLQPVYITERGELYNRRGQRIGYLS